MFSEQRHHRFDLWREQFDVLRQPKLFNLRRDPYERADTDSNTYNEWVLERVPIFYKSVTVIGPFMKSFQEYPPSQAPQSSDPGKFKVENRMGMPGSTRGYLPGFDAISLRRHSRPVTE